MHAADDGHDGVGSLARVCAGAVDYCWRALAADDCDSFE